MTQKPEKKPFELKWLAWEITGRCNLNCIHCRSSSTMDPGEGDYPLEEAKALICDITSFSRPVVVLTGGEPLLHPDIFEIAAYGTGRGLRMAMATNGMLVDDEICRKIKESGICIAALSLDGSVSEIHDDFRKQPGAFDGTLRAAQILKRNGVDFIINSSFTRRNQEDIPHVYRLAKKLGARAWYMFMIVPIGRGEDLIDELISKEDYEKILRWHFDMECREKEILVRPTCAPHYYRIVHQEAEARGIDFERRNLAFGTGGAKGCVAAQSIAFIGHRGEARPCSYFSQDAGSVHETSFRDIWENSPLFRDIRNFDAYKGKCGSCEYLNVCGGCRARAFAASGDYMQEEPFCSFIPRKMTRQAVKERSAK